jgi:hypothetical protein
MVGKSDRERLTWITTNSKKLNSHFNDTPGMVDIMPFPLPIIFILPFQNLQKEELDGVPFIGAIDFFSTESFARSRRDF